MSLLATRLRCGEYKRMLIRYSRTSRVCQVCQMSQDSTSEVGSATPPTTEEQLRQIIELQNKYFIELGKSIQATVRDSSVNRGIALPKFNPHSSVVSASHWCVTADIILTQKPLEGSGLVMALSNSMMGNTSQWLTQIFYPGIK